MTKLSVVFRSCREGALKASQHMVSSLCTFVSLALRGDRNLASCLCLMTSVLSLVLTCDLHLAELKNKPEYLCYL